MKMPAGGEATPPDGSPSEEAAGADATPKAITMEALEAIITKVRSDVKADFGRELKSLRDAVGAAKAPASPSKGAEESAVETPTEKTLRERLTALEGREALQKSGAVRMALREALVKAGADVQLSDLAVPMVLESEGSQFAASPNRVGGYDVSYGDGLTIGQWAQNFMASDLGKRITAPSEAAGLGLPAGTSRSAPTKRQVPKSMVATLSDADLRSGNIEIVDG